MEFKGDNISAREKLKRTGFLTIYILANGAMETVAVRGIFIL